MNLLVNNISKSDIKRKKSLIPLFTVIFFDHTGISMIFPVLTLIFFDSQTRLFDPGVSQATRSLFYGLCNSLPPFIGMIAVPILSILSDKLGRKKILFVCTLGTVIFSLCGATGILIGSVVIVFISRSFNGVFARVQPIGQAIVGDISESYEKPEKMGYLQFMVSFSSIIGPIIGGYLAKSFFFGQLNFSLPYFVAAMMAVIAAFFALFYFRETNHTAIHQKTTCSETFLSFINLLKNKKILQISFILMLFQFTWGTYYQFAPPLVKVLFGFSYENIGIFIAARALCLALTALIGIKFIGKFVKKDKLIRYSNYVIVLGFIMTIMACFFHNNVYLSKLVWLGMIPITVGDIIAFCCVSALYSDVAGHHDQGKSMGICFFIVSAVWGIGSMMGGVFGAVSISLPIIVAPIGSIIFIIYSHSKQYKNLLLN